MKNAGFDTRKIGIPNGWRWFKLNLEYYEDLLNQKTQSVTDWVRIQNDTWNTISEWSFRNTNIRFLQHVIAPNYYLFHAYLMDEISSHDSRAVERIVREDIISILEVPTSEK